MTETATEELRGHRAVWRIEPPIPGDLRTELGDLSVMLSHLLYCRGYRTAAAIQGFLAGAAVSHDPFLLPDMDEAVARIALAAASAERVAVYGDFDCDGLTAAAALVDLLTALGLEPIVHIPSRMDGHGLHTEGLAALADRGVTLIVTADCGITAIEEVAVARGMGMDVVITDHHEARVDGSLPDCPAVDPTRHDSHYPFRHLCGVGVVYKLAQALAARLPRAAHPDEILDLAAVGTVADVVPLLDENRSFVIRGLQRLRRTKRPGLLALFEAADIKPEKIDPVAVGFYLAPRINAANRMAEPQLAYELITARDSVRARALAEHLSRLNRQRQDLVEERFAALAAEIGDAPALQEAVTGGRHPRMLMVVGDWPPGISGLLATKLVERYGLPAFVAADGGDGPISVSARGVPGAHIDELLESSEASLPGGLFLGYGGHARAGGFRVEREKLPLARSILEAHADRHIPGGSLGAVLNIDAEVGLEALTLEAAKRIRSLAPFGMGFEEPLFLARGVTLQTIRPMGGGKHAHLTLQGSTARMGGPFFSAPPALFDLRPGARLDVVFHLDIDEWDGLSRARIRIRDWRPC